jgi:hypothetical protein
MDFQIDFQKRNEDFEKFKNEYEEAKKSKIGDIFSKNRYAFFMHEGELVNIKHYELENSIIFGKETKSLIAPEIFAFCYELPLPIFGNYNYLIIDKKHFQNCLEFFFKAYNIKE